MIEEICKLAVSFISPLNAMQMWSPLKKDNDLESNIIKFGLKYIS